MRKLTLSLAVMAALLPSRGIPLGLGEIELNSALNQELNAEIEVLSASPEDADQLIVQLADRDAFNRAGIDRPYILQQLKFKVAEKNGQPVVKVYTKTPIREPFLSFLLEIDWPQGHLLREYTLLLDPPVYNTSPAVAPTAGKSDHPFIDPADSQAQPQPVSSQQLNAPATHSSYQAPVASQGMQAGVISSDSGRSMTYQYQPMPTAQPAMDQYRVQQNDTLWSMANRMRPDSSVSVEQMMLALVRENPEAFIQENINGVKRGYILRIPSRDEATQITRQEAVAEARDHAALWREYSQGATSAAPASSMEADEPMGTAADQPRDAQGHLSIVGASERDGSEHAGSNQDPESELSRLKQDLAMAREQLESEKMEKEDLRARLADLEQRVQRVIEMDDGELAKLQQELQQSQQVPEQAEEPVVEEPVAEQTAEGMAEVTEEPVAEEPLTEEPVVEEMPAEGVVTEEMPVDEAAEQPSEEAVFVDETAPVETEVDEAAEMPAQVVQPVRAIEPPAFAQQKPKSFIESLMDDPKLLGMIGGGLAFVFLLIALLLKRLRGNKADESEEWSPELDNDVAENLSAAEPDLESETVQSEPLDLTSTAELMAEPSDDLGMDDTQVNGPDDLEDTVFNLQDDDKPQEEDKQDDVLAEADVYLAYGIYQQAEELLNTAIDQNPDRDDYRMKMLETHFAAKNASAFEHLAQEVQSRKGGDAAFWNRVCVMGNELSPGNSLYAGSDASLADFDADALLPDKPQTTDLELNVGDAQDEDLDLGGLDELDTESTQGFSEPLDLEAEQSLEDDSFATDDLDLAGDLESITSEISVDETEESAELEAAEGFAGDDQTSADLEFDLGEMDDLGSLDDSVEETAEEESADLDIDDDFSLDFAASDLGFEESEDEQAVTAESDADDITLDADLDLGVDLDESADTEESIEMDLSDDLGDMDLGDVELDMGDEGSQGEELDMGDLDLDDSLDDSISLDAGDAAEEVSLDLSDSDDDFDISDLSDDIDEVSTKLDLAKAYIDMGDKEGARSILEEVKAEGNSEQQQQADELMQQAS